MFVFSLKADTIKRVTATVLALAIATGAGFFVLNKMNEKQAEVSAKETSFKAETNEERIKFLSSFGWQVEEDPLEVSEEIIPEDFNEEYESYNAIQKAQNLDLEKYKGERVKKWTYSVTNYTYTDCDEGSIRANLLIYNGVIIGGDISNISPEGFIRGFSGKE